MSEFIAQYPLVACLAAFFVATLAGAIDLIVLKNRVLAIVFWLWGFPAVVMPLVWKESWGDWRWLLAASVAVIYIFVVVWIYRVLAPQRAEPVAMDDEQ